MIACVSGLVSRGGGEDALQERYTPQEWNLRDSKQRREQQLCTGQREVWWTLTNRIPQSRWGLAMFSQYIYSVCVCVGPWAARMAATQRSRTQRLRSKQTQRPTPTPTPCPSPPLARRSSTTSLTTRRPCPLSAPAKPCTPSKVTASVWNRTYTWIRCENMKRAWGLVGCCWWDPGVSGNTLSGDLDGPGWTWIWMK